jgi:hypothetical protein
MTCTCGCPTGCGELPSRFPITNPSGLTQLAYRVGTFSTFRRALLQSLGGETELNAWKPTAADDLGLQLLDWWAYIADILTFYNERIANEDYLGTAQLDASVAHLVSLLGYRPRPGIGAVGTLAVIASGPAPLIVPAGTAIASKATPDVDSQTFETTDKTTFTQPTSVPRPTPDDLATAPPVDGPPTAVPGAAEPPPHIQLIARFGVLVKGTPTSITVGDQLLLLPTDWKNVSEALQVQVTGLVPEPDPHGRRNTRVLLNGTGTPPPQGDAQDYRLVYPTRTGHLSTLPAGANVINDTTLVLDAPARYLKVGDPLVVEAPNPSGPGTVVRLTNYDEQLWYANAPSPSSPTTPPNSSTPPPPGIPLIVASLTIDAGGADLTQYQPDTVTVYSGWKDVGTLLDTPVQTLTALPHTLTLAAKPAAPAGAPTAALLEDTNGTGSAVTAVPDANSTQVTITGNDATLMAPLRLLWDLITVTRGATVHDEPLGTGDGTQPGQDFTLSKKPVTFLSDFPGRSGDGYSSTVILTVDGRYWTEVPTLYGHGPGEAVFETYNDDAGSTHVRTGDGLTGRRLASAAQVVATYRVGSGLAVPPAGSLTQVLTAVPNLRAVRNPVPPGGGSDPQPADSVRTLAPRSVLTFGRAISGDDYVAVAAAAPGVTRAAAVWEFDPTEQRPLVRVYVGDDDRAVASARAALAAQIDPNRPLVVLRAVELAAFLSLSLRLDPTYVADAVYSQVRTAVQEQIFAPGVLALGEPLYRSRIEEVVTDVPGVLAVHDLLMSWSIVERFIRPLLVRSAGPEFNPGPGGFFTLQPTNLRLPEGVRAGD